jgi:hypothetical protein
VGERLGCAEEVRDQPVEVGAHPGIDLPDARDVEGTDPVGEPRGQYAVGLRQAIGDAVGHVGVDEGEGRLEACPDRGHVIGPLGGRRLDLDVEGRAQSRQPERRGEHDGGRQSGEPALPLVKPADDRSGIEGVQARAH